MAYTVKYHGYEVSCDTADDLRALLSSNGNGQPKTGKVAIHDSALHDGKALVDVAAFVGKLRNEQRDLLRYVATNGKITRERLRQLVGISDPHQFAGILISISKIAAGVGMKSPIETVDERENGNGPRTYQYQLRDEVRAEVRKALSV